MKEVRFGLIGLGAMGMAHATTLLGDVPNARLCAAATASRAHAAELLALPGAEDVRVFATPAEMYQSGLIDAVLIATPHRLHVRQAVEAGITVTSLPGPVAAVTALTISGLPTRRFAFEAFLPTEKANKKERQRILEELRTETRTMILYEAPHKLRVTLQDLADVLGTERRISLCRELTKKHEEAIRTTLGDAIALYQEEDPLGEYVLVIEGRTPESITEEAQANWNAMPLTEHMQHYLDQGMSEKDAMKAVAKDRGVSKRDIYNELKT